MKPLTKLQQEFLTKEFKKYGSYPNYQYDYSELDEIARITKEIIDYCISKLYAKD